MRKEQEHEYGYKVRLLRILRAIVENPNAYTIRFLADKYNVNRSVIKHDFEAIKSAGFVMEWDKNYCYKIVQEKPFKQLKDLLHFSEEDQSLLHHAIDRISPHTKSGERLKRKLASLYDFRRLGHAYLRKPYLDRLDKLLKAKKEKKCVELLDYRSSNSNKVSDRLVEPYHICPDEDTIQTWDLNREELRNFRISRIGQVQLLSQAWNHEGSHHVMPTDPFRIVDKHQIMVHLRIKVGAKNEMEELFPMSRAYILPSEEDNIYDFQGKVNHKFIGLTNFILSNYHRIEEIVGPEELTDHLKHVVKEIKGLMD